MPLKIPEADKIVRSGKTYVLKQPAFANLDLSTALRNLVLALLKGLSLALHDWYVALKDYGDHEPFPQTARGDFLTKGWWVDITKLKLTPETPASGSVVMTGTVGAIVLKDKQLQAGNRLYRVKQSALVVAQSLNATSLTFANGKAIFETASDHHLASGLSVSISGADQAEYNGTHEIEITAANEFTFDLPGTPASPATGTISAALDMALVQVEALDVGQFTNIETGGRLRLVEPLADISDAAYTIWGGVTGGTDKEEPEAFRERILEALAATLGVFTEDEIVSEVKNVPGVTRVWVLKAKEHPVEGEPAEGQVKIGFLRDNDANPFPSAQEVADVKDRLAKTIMPAHMVDTNLMVFSPTPQKIDFQFASISPDSAAMRLAVTNNLRQFFLEIVELGEDVTRYDYECAIKRSIDNESGEALKNFQLTTPVGDVAIGITEMAALGTVSFA